MDKSFDVIVAGGGPAGFASSIAAAREGAKILLIEATGCLGGQGTSGLVGPFMGTAGEEGIYTELRKRLDSMGGLQDERRFDAEKMKLCMQLMVEEAGVEQLLFTTIAGAQVKDGKVTGLSVVNKAGLQQFDCKMLIDCTGDGDVAAFAGAAFEKGDEDGRMQAITLFFTIGGIDDQAYEDGMSEYREQCKEFTRKERSAGNLHLPEHVTLSMVWKGSTLSPGQYSVNMDTAMGVDGTDPGQLTEAMNESRKRVFEAIEYFRKYLPGGKNCYLVQTASILGIRETRRFKGLSYITGKDVVEANKFDDAICKASFFLDLHDGSNHQEASERFGANRPPEADWYEIPYGCLIPENINGLLLAGRNISTDRYANGSLRVMPTCMSTGQAAGIAAAICSRERTEPRDLEVKRIQKILADQYGMLTAKQIGAKLSVA